MCSALTKPIFRPSAGATWPGLAESAVRHMLAVPTEIRHYNLFGINVDQWIFARDGEGDLSLFLRAGRVIAPGRGREVPGELFRVELPSSPNGGGSTLAPRLGMTTNDVQALYGAPRYRVDYVFSGQPSLHAVYKVGEKGTFTAVTFVDGVATELEDLGTVPNDPVFQGR
jgi:hypothetical protein